MTAQTQSCDSISHALDSRVMSTMCDEDALQSHSLSADALRVSDKVTSKGTKELHGECDAACLDDFDASTLAGESLVECEVSSHLAGDEEHVLPGNTEASKQATSKYETMQGFLAWLHHANLRLHPRRQELFECMSRAVAKALGQRLKRIMLVGSAALQVDTPLSDVDAVAFSNDGDTGANTLLEIAEAIEELDSTLRVRVVCHARVPVLIMTTSDGEVSLDLSLDQSMAAFHVAWFQRLQMFPKCGGGLPLPKVSYKELGLEATALKCVKWWLQQRRIPGSKEGGYPALVWTLLALHLLQCSLRFLRAEGLDYERQILLALTAFFTRFSSQGQDGRILFMHNGFSTFQPAEGQSRAPPRFFPQLSIPDPVRMADWSVAPTALVDSCGELVPALSPGTELLYAAELRRARRLSGAALKATADASAAILSDLFSSREFNSLPSNVDPAASPIAAFFVRGTCLEMAILRRVRPKSGWSAPFLHRRDKESSVWTDTYDVWLDDLARFNGRLILKSRGVLFSACHFVGIAELRSTDPLALLPDDIERWKEMCEILKEHFQHRPEGHQHRNSQHQPDGHQRRKGDRGRQRASRRGQAKGQG
eukprot:TRINITY_DN41356_c0_g1_i1.p1 TRINITY_DN41356_c0_g1~~TRINITY_DN41356_c0_g1_i1.p1  ORF type:complete len:596 (-),score=110.79 TRINITY_DN41356_c0_g1_i1:14-1801(-)